MLNNKTLLSSRVRDGFIREGHGDIHAEHVSFSGGRLSIIDCIEFNERFRFADTISDIAFLSMDLDYLNRHDLSKIVEAAYLKRSRDKNGSELLNFYKCYRAYVRGKVSAFKSKESEVGIESAMPHGLTQGCTSTCPACMPQAAFVPRLCLSAAFREPARLIWHHPLPMPLTSSASQATRQERPCRDTGLDARQGRLWQRHILRALHGKRPTLQ